MELTPTGNIGLIVGMILALLASGMAFWYYLRETRSLTGGWIMAGIRSLVVALLVMMFIEPVLRTQDYIGQQGRLFLLLDQSRSMSIQDRYTDPGKRLQLLLRYDLIDSDRINRALPEASRIIRHVSKTVTNQVNRSGNRMNVDALDSSVSSDLRSVANRLEEVDAKHIASGQTERGQILFEVWEDVSGNIRNVKTLRNADGFPDQPDDVKMIQAFSSPRNRGDNYGSRVRGYLIPPETGSYRFWMTSDDASALYLSSDDNPENSRLITRVKKATGFDQWENSDSQKSEPIQLRAGHRYYIETLHREGGGGDYVRVGWTRPDGNKQRPIPGTFLAPVRHGGPDSPEARKRELVKQLNDLADRMESISSTSDTKGSNGETEKKLVQIQDELSDVRQRIQTSFSSFAGRLFQRENMDWSSKRQSLHSMTRWDRLRKTLIEKDPSTLRQLSEEHEIELWSAGQKKPERLWKPAQRNGDITWSDLSPEAKSTNLTASLRKVVEQSSGDQKTAAVLISDGQHNRGPSTEDPAIVLGQRDIPVHTVGLGPEKQPEDLSILNIQSPESVFHKDRVKGTIEFMDHMPAGQSVNVQIYSDEKQVWETDIKTKGNGRRTVSYDFSIEELVKSMESDEDDQETVSQPLSFQARMQPLDAEQNKENNNETFHTAAVTQKQRLLLIDGRPRWEFRYVRNLFKRDPLWNIEPLIRNDYQNTSKRKRSENNVQFHEKTPGAYDLVLFGDVPSDQMSEQQLNWLNRFVNQRGGGMIFVDGQNEHLRTYSNTPMDPLFPVEWSNTNQVPSDSRPERLRLTDAGKQTSSFLLASNQTMTQDLLRVLPSPHWTAPVSARPGTETLLEAVYGNNTARPAAVHRRFGAGQVLYLATDELWRWRYEVADKYHNRFWNQVARWVQEKPFMVRNEHMALGTDKAIYNEGDRANIRARLFVDKPPETVQAILRRNERTEATVQLERVSEQRNLFRGTSPVLSKGDYEIALAVGDLSSEEEVKQKVPVVKPENREFIALNQNRELLERISHKSGGTYLPEEQSDRLPNLLESLSSGHWERREIVLWQSWWLFLPVILLLSLEWVLRKWYGLV